MPKLIFSHGFGVRADARGLFTEIAAAFPKFDSVLFEYNTLAEDGNTIVTSIDKQVKILQSMLKGVDSDSYLIAHSQGCMVAALAKLPPLKGVILLTPPKITNMNRVIEKMKARAGSVINLDGMSKYPRSDGKFTYIPREYIESLGSLGDNDDLYQSLSENASVTIIQARNDHVLGDTDFSDLASAHVIELPGDHEFSSVADRVGLIRELHAIIG